MKLYLYTMTLNFCSKPRTHFITIYINPIKKPKTTLEIAIYISHRFTTYLYLIYIKSPPPILGSELLI